MLRKLLFLSFLVLLLATQTFADEDDKDILATKSRIITQKGQKAEQKGDIEDAVAFYEEAYNLYPKNIYPLLLWGKALGKIGMYERSKELLDKVAVEKLSTKAGRSEVHLLKGQIAVALGSLEDAATHFSRSVKASEDNLKARVRLATVNQMLGMSNRADELLYDYDSFEGLPFKEMVLAFFIDLQLGNLGRAYGTVGVLSNYMIPANYIEESPPFLLSLWQQRIIAFVTFLPLALNTGFSVIYFLILFGILMFFASRLAPPTAFWHDLLFVFAGTAFMVLAQSLGKSELFMAALTEQFSVNDSVWIIPRLLISGNLIAVGMLVIFPAFKLLPEEQRPRRYEYYGIWFFCWFFMIFVLVFQSRMSFGPRSGIMIGSAVLAFLTSFFMPLGRFILFKIGELFGISSFADVDRKQLGKSSSISFTEAKILETKAWKLLESEDWDEVVLTARKVQSNLDKQTFPKLWKTMILALIAREDYIEAQKALGEFLQVFTNNALKESGQLLEAYLKSCLGDYPSALKIIRSFSEDRVKSFAADETALSLLILGRCDLAYKDNVQAHIDLNKSFAIAQLSFLKAEALVEIIELDFKMNSKEMIGKLKAKIVDINGGKKSQSLVKTIQSIVAMSEGNKPKALELALAACEIAVRNSRACAWYGHLLCLEGRQNEAEQLLDKMTPESVDATRLMTEVTSSTA